jgi:hypothetical protein
VYSCDTTDEKIGKQGFLWGIAVFLPIIQEACY